MILTARKGRTRIFFGIKAVAFFMKAESAMERLEVAIVRIGGYEGGESCEAGDVGAFESP